MAECDGRRKPFIKREFFFFVATTRLFDETKCVITTKQHECRFLVLKTNIQNVAARFALKTFGTAFIIVFLGKDIDPHLF